jgi:NTP pyrophosphatase (non-canonical NTP hydrolase)
MTSHPLIGPLASFESIGRELVASFELGCGLAAPQFLVDINERAKARDADPRAVGSLCRMDPQCHEAPIPCPHHVERVDAATARLAAGSTPPAEAAQVGELPPLPEWSKRDDLGGLVPSEIRTELRAYARAAIAALAQQRIPESVRAVLAELDRATRKFPTWPTDPLHAVAVLGEEAGELTKAVLQAVYEPHKSTPEDVATEAIQTAAMALRFIDSLPRYVYARGEQHSQQETRGNGE